MPTLLDTLDPETTTTRSFGEELQASTAAVRLSLKWFGICKSVTGSQKHVNVELLEDAFIEGLRKSADRQTERVTYSEAGKRGFSRTIYHAPA